MAYKAGDGEAVAPPKAASLDQAPLVVKSVKRRQKKSRDSIIDF